MRQSESLNYITVCDHVDGVNGGVARSAFEGTNDPVDYWFISSTWLLQSVWVMSKTRYDDEPESV
jgi:hypothetical protein